MNYIQLISFGTNPILKCSTIDCTIYNLCFEKNGKKYFLDEVTATLNWWNNVVSWISFVINNEIIYLDNSKSDIPIYILEQATYFMMDVSNYKHINCDMC
jgi:hypothetical protein